MTWISIHFYTCKFTFKLWEFRLGAQTEKENQILKHDQFSPISIFFITLAIKDYKGATMEILFNVKSIPNVIYDLPNT